MAQSKITAFEKVFNGQGEHKTWVSDKFPGTNYEFKVTFENGDVGTGSSKSAEGGWKIGTEYTYEKSSREYNGNTYHSFKNIKSLDSGKGNWNGRGGSSKSHWEDPLVQKRITRAHAMIKASEYLATKEDQSQVTPEAVNTLADHMFEWCYMSIDISKTGWHEDLLDRRSCLTNAILQIPIKSLNITSWSSLAKQAENNYTYLKQSSEKQQ
jgi:hypothetical protein